MSSTLNPLPSVVIRQWEEANTQLTNSLSNYLCSCIALESLSEFPKSTSVQNWTVDMDNVIDYLRNTAFGQLAQSFSSLARTRNKLATSPCSLPTEILIEIFRSVIYAPRELEPLKAGIRTLYRRLHTLVSVCSEWRRVGLAQGSFWSIIPLMQDGSRDLDYVTQMCLQRSGSSALSLAADLERSMPKIKAALIEHAARFRSLNIKAHHAETFRDYISLWLNHDIPGSVNELSVCFDPIPINSRPGRYNVDTGGVEIFPHGSSVEPLLAEFMATLSILRMTGVHLPLNITSFDNLAELRVDYLEFGNDSYYRRFLCDLSTMPSLRLLHLIRLRAWYTTINPDSSDAPTDTPILFPSLQTLYLGDLSLDFLNLTFTSIAPGSFQVVLYLGHNGDFSSDVRPLLPVLQGRDVFELLLRYNSMFPLLQILPTLRSLWIDVLAIEESEIEGLTQLSNRNNPFPVLRELHVSKLIVSQGSTELFKKILASHAIEKLTIGAITNESPKGVPSGSTPETDNSHSVEDINAIDELATWLKSAVPNFRLLNRLDRLPEFKLPMADVWPLW